jgi:hypothetical protein
MRSGYQNKKKEKKKGRYQSKTKREKWKKQNFLLLSISYCYRTQTRKELDHYSPILLIYPK